LHRSQIVAHRPEALGKLEPAEALHDHIAQQEIKGGVHAQRLVA